MSAGCEFDFLPSSSPFLRAESSSGYAGTGYLGSSPPVSHCYDGKRLNNERHQIIEEEDNGAAATASPTSSNSSGGFAAAFAEALSKECNQLTERQSSINLEDCVRLNSVNTQQLKKATVSPSYVETTVMLPDVFGASFTPTGSLSPYTSPLKGISLPHNAPASSSSSCSLSMMHAPIAGDNDGQTMKNIDGSSNCSENMMMMEWGCTLSIPKAEFNGSNIRYSICVTIGGRSTTACRCHKDLAKLVKGTIQQRLMRNRNDNPMAPPLDLHFPESDCLQAVVNWRSSGSSSSSSSSSIAMDYSYNYVEATSALALVPSRLYTCSDRMMQRMQHRASYDGGSSSNDVGGGFSRSGYTAAYGGRSGGGGSGRCRTTVDSKLDVCKRSMETYLRDLFKENPCLQHDERVKYFFWDPITPAGIALAIIPEERAVFVCAHEEVHDSDDNEGGGAGG